MTFFVGRKNAILSLITKLRFWFLNFRKRSNFEAFSGLVPSKLKFFSNNNFWKDYMYIEELFEPLQNQQFYGGGGVGSPVP